MSQGKEEQMSPTHEHQGQVVANEAGDPLGLFALTDAV